MKIEEMIAANRADCSGCAACANVCPKNAIVMTRDAEGFAYPKINSELCISCGRCDATCPALNFKAGVIDDFPKTFVAIYDDDKILRHSSSGGAFTALSEIILREGGVVFGAAFDKNWRVVHTSAENLDELENLRRSKYAQSQIGDVYRQAKKSLEADRKVLFSGTPCQCVGLKHFLGKDYDNLLTVDILCHGTPSPGIWENYIGELGYAHEVVHVNFRSKRNGWGSNLDINFNDRGHTMVANSKNLYGKLFLIGISERPACQSCKFKIPNGQADLTLGDAWGIKDFAPEMFDSRGVSVVFVHTDKGKTFFEQTNLKTRQVKFIDAVKKNVHAVSPTIADARRKDFFAELAKNSDWSTVMKKYYQDDDAAVKERRKKNGAAYNKNFRAIAAQVRKKFEDNVLIVAASAEDLEQRFPNRAVYFLYLNAKGQLICKENFSALTFEQKEVAALADFAKEFNVTEIYVEEPSGIESPIVDEWLKTCSLPIKTLNVAL